MKRICCLIATLTALNFAARAEETEAIDVPHTHGEVWSPQRFQREFYGDDKWEPFNRTMFWFTDVTLTYIAKPINVVYTSIIPKPLIKGINNAIKNTEYPVRLLADLFRAEWGGAWTETERFCINTTVGLAGLFDPARDWLYIYSTDASFSGTFYAWGIAPGPTCAFPFTPYSNIRDNCGYVLDKCLDPKNFIDYMYPTGIWIGWTASLWPNYAPIWADPWNVVIEPHYDHYRAFLPMMTVKSSLQRDFWAYRRIEAYKAGLLEDARPSLREEIEKPETLAGSWRTIEGFKPRTPAIDTMRSLIWRAKRNDDFWWSRESIWNSDFASEVSSREVLVEGAEFATPYSFVSTAPVVETREKLAFVIPGIVGRRDSDSTLAMGELLNENGFKVVLCDDIFSWEYMRSENKGILPGNLPEDAKRFAAFMSTVIDDLREDKKIDNPDVYIVGWSMGGITATHLAALEKRGELGFDVKKILAINAPVDIRSAMGEVDDMFSVLNTWDRERVRKVCTEAAGALYAWADSTDPNKDEDIDAPNISEEEARFAIAVTMSMPLPELIAVSHDMKPFEQIKSKKTAFHRDEFYREIEEVGCRDYIRDYLISFYPGMSYDDLFAATSLKSLEQDIATNDKLVMIHAWDDVFMNEDDREYLDKTLKDRITWFSVGSHCGNFYTKEFHEEVISRLLRD
ncbi:MAG: MlaA family lipoprotein [Kiritimatiellae bacterium]|nr:MlaA family lipoprotein [Kiritimatiellia bacterium]